MFDNFILLSHCAVVENSMSAVAWFQGQIKSKSCFIEEVKSKCAAFSALKSDHIALYYEEAYEFAVDLYALLHLGKTVWVANNNKIVTAEKLIQQGCQLVGDWLDVESIATESVVCDWDLQPLDSNRMQLMIYTSGSSAEPKVIAKSLAQLQAEIEVLEQCWGQQLGDAQTLATVSHQHIYGLLFRLLWPLAAGRCFHSQLFLSPEALLKAGADKPCYWVSSPAQLKRLDSLSQWQELAGLQAIFSSGGMLSEPVAEQIQQLCRHKVIEVYGSSETGGIAWRQIADNPLWTPFSEISLALDDSGHCWLNSPYLPDQRQLKLDDKIELQSDGQFVLLGRLDRIVKVEEKRLSLDAMESALKQSDWVQQAHTLLVTEKRDKIAVVLVLTKTGENYLIQNGQKQLIKQLRKQLMKGFETVVLPRKWLFMNAIPETAQGKIDQALIQQLFLLDSARFPRLLRCYFQQQSVELQLRIHAELIYFSGHFPEQPILPGVTQLAWVETFGKLFFNIEQPFLRLEVIKFKKIIQPGDVIKMELKWKTESAKLYFTLRSGDVVHSSGRMVYGVD